MRDNKRGTIEDRRATDALAFEQEKQEKLLAEAWRPGEPTLKLLRETAHSVADAVWPAPNTVEEAEFGPAVRDPLDSFLRDMNYGGERALSVAICAVECAADAGLVKTVADCLDTFRRIRDGLAVHDVR